ncbi:MAG: caspase family protein [Thermoanaerobaculia bacterium]|nr:caspase family protein [Thermoanaerobaculia bacterium]
MLRLQQAEAQSKGLFLVTVASHGLTVQGGDFLVAADTLWDHIPHPAVAVSQFLDQVATTEAQRCLVLLDACRERLWAGQRGRRGAAAEPMSESFANAIASASGLAMLAATTRGGFAYDDLARMNGVFTAAVIDGLSGEAAADDQGFITVGTLAVYVQKRVVAWVRAHRKDDAWCSKGIGRQIEGDAEALPLVVKELVREVSGSYRDR